MDEPDPRPLRLYAVFRPPLPEAGRRGVDPPDHSHGALHRLGEEIRWVRSYVLEERDAPVAMVSIYAAATPEAIRRHSARAGLPVLEIAAIASVVTVHPEAPPDAA